MSGTLDESMVACPYCGETISLLIDDSAGSQSYVEDCQVCCRPINVTISIDSQGRSAVTVADDYQ